MAKKEPKKTDWNAYAYPPLTPIVEPLESIKAQTQVDLTKAQPGDIVEFRCGGKMEIEKIPYKSPSKVDFIFKWDNNPGNKTWERDGRRFGKEYDSFLDIVKVTPKPFDWKDVEWGMSFKQVDRNLMFIGMTQFGHGVFSNDCGGVETFGPSDFGLFKRNPGNDKKSVKV